MANIITLHLPPKLARAVDKAVRARTPKGGKPNRSAYFQALVEADMRNTKQEKPA